MMNIIYFTGKKLNMKVGMAMGTYWAMYTHVGNKFGICPHTL